MTKKDIFGNTYFVHGNQEVIDFLRDKAKNSNEVDAQFYEEVIERIERYVPDKKYPQAELSQDVLKYCCEYFVDLQKKYSKKIGKNGSWDREFGVLNETFYYYAQQYEYVKNRDGEL